jgi:plastocyanin
MRHPGTLTAIIGTTLAVLLQAGMGGAQQKGATAHTIFLTALEVKGSTTADALAPPTVNPADLSKGYGFKGPGQADKNAPQRWEVSSYLFAPAWVTVRRGDTVALTVFVVNGDEHEVSVMAPDGQRVVATAKWNRGREYHAEFVAARAGTYQLVCSTHAPSMIASFGVLSE